MGNVKHGLVASERSLGDAVREALQKGPFAMRQLAASSGLSYDVLRSWRSGRRRPNGTSALRLAGGLQAQATRLQRLADAILAAEAADRPDSRG